MGAAARGDPQRAYAGFTRLLQRIRTLDDEDAVSLSPVYELWSGWAQPLTAPTILYSEAFGVTVSVSAGTPVRLWDDAIGEEDLDIDLVTAETLQAQFSDRDSRAVMADLAERVGIGSRPVPELSLDSLIADLQARANEYLATLLRDAPVLDLDLRPAAEWLSQPAVRWLARRLESDNPIPIQWLSHAECRWATLAIRMALSSSPAPLLILDEPEAALHRTAEAHMAAALADMSARATARFVVSTHSPELLDSRGAMRVLVRRRTPEMTGELVPFTGAALEAMDELGLQPSDLLRRTRGYLLVEGEHDIAVLRGWFDDDFTELGVQVLPLRGGTKLRTVLDSRFLFDYTDAVLFPFLDDIDAERVQSAWETAIRARKTQRSSEVIDALIADLKTLGSKGLEYMVPFLTRALERGRENRVVPLGIHRTDIIDYLPVEEFVPTAASWDDLRAELRSAKGGVDGNETEFKAWLRRKYHVDLAPEAVAEVARRSDPAEEISLLIDKLKIRLRV